jgi:hypothetical protein
MSVPDSRGASVVTASPREDGTRMGKSMTAEDRFEREGDIATKLEVRWQDLPKTTASMVSREEGPRYNTSCLVRKPEIQPLASLILGCSQIVVSLSLCHGRPDCLPLLVPHYVVILVKENPSDVPCNQS